MTSLDDDKNDATRSYIQMAKDTIIGHYRIIEKIGAGGMGEVYLAEDTELNRKVALKFLPPHLCQDADCRARFKREAQAAAKLGHSNIVAVHEVGEYHGRPFFAMELVEGRPLDKIVAEDRLGESEIVDLALGICNGLRKAHESGVIHRDVKPSNIIVDRDNVPRVLDFGLAAVRDGDKLTQTGLTPGTIGYMSPEQVAGRAADARSDLFSLGVVLYEMITGINPFWRDNQAATLKAISEDIPKPPKRDRSDISGELQRIASKLLEKKPELRYQTAADLAADLRRCQSSRVSQIFPSKSIVVLPFENLSPDPGQEYFSDGLTEEVISDLSGIAALRVISRSSAMTFKGTKKKVPDIAREVNVRYVLEGSVRISGNSLRITAQLIDATTDAHVWAEKYSGTLDNVFEIQERVSRAIVGAMRLKLTSKEESKLAERPIETFTAYERYLKGNQELWRLTEASLDRALQYFQAALDMTGDNALVFSGMAETYFQYVNLGIKQEEYISKAEEYIEKAFAVDPDSAKAHSVHAWLIASFRGKIAEAIRHCKKALATCPHELIALQILPMAYIFIGKRLEAIRYSDILIQIDPLAHHPKGFRGAVNLYSGEYSAASDLLRGYYQADSGNPVAQFYYAWALAYCDQPDEARSIIDRATRENPGNVMANLSLLLGCVLLNDKDRALQLIGSEFRKTCERDPEYSHTVACMLAKLDMKSESLDWLELSVNRGFINYPLMAKQDPFLTNIRGEERFKKLMERVRCEWERIEV